jgi:hypothetical protein
MILGSTQHADAVLGEHLRRERGRVDRAEHDRLAVGRGCRLRGRGAAQQRPGRCRKAAEQELASRAAPLYLVHVPSSASLYGALTRTVADPTGRV